MYFHSSLKFLGFASSSHITEATQRNLLAVRLLRFNLNRGEALLMNHNTNITFRGMAYTNFVDLESRISRVRGKVNDVIVLIYNRGSSNPHYFLLVSIHFLFRL